ncbi:flagellin [Butyrivibrio sp. ob235]|uniref:flagellin n=1 Tax=unclassified Butyrivibrio TaxID=2639466 RepID=UPI0003B47750|nr:MULTISPECIES: flagellin [unclassified Butyrivibrio]SEL51052.1 flagellin [Butyrivibrio sp. ob235]
MIGGISNNSYSNYSQYGKIASGKKLQSAADDAAGLAINEKMEKEQRTMKVQARNGLENIGQLNIKDGVLDGVTDYLQSIRENAVYAQNGTLSASDRSDIANANSQLMQGIGQQLDSSQMKSLGLDKLDVNNLDSIDAAIANVSNARGEVGAVTNGFEHNVSYSNIARENLLSAQSSIADTDIAQEVTELKKNQTLDAYRLQMQKKQQDDEQQKSNMMNLML